MKAIFATHPGGPEVLREFEVPVPDIGDDEVLLRIHAAGVNPVDYKIRSNGYNLRFPLILGYDVAGTVVRVGRSVRDFRDGDEVFAMLGHGRLGGYAEFVAAKAAQLAPKPGNVSFQVAAAIPVAGLTAWTALFVEANVAAGQRVLVHAAAGGVGAFTVQLAKWAGAYVIGTASGSNTDYLRSLGVDQVIDYGQQPFESLAREVDVAIDNVGGETLRRSYQTLKQNGVLVSVVDPVDERLLKRYGIRGSFFGTQVNAAHLSRLGELVSAGKVAVHLDRQLPLSEAAAAHVRLESRRTRGKVVLCND